MGWVCIPISTAFEIPVSFLGGCFFGEVFFFCWEIFFFYGVRDSSFFFGGMFFVGRSSFEGNAMGGLHVLQWVAVCCSAVRERVLCKNGYCARILCRYSLEGSAMGGLHVLQWVAACCSAARERVLCKNSLQVFFEGQCYGVATMSRRLKMIGLFGRISSLLLGSFAKETYNFRSLLVVATPYTFS